MANAMGMIAVAPAATAATGSGQETRACSVAAATAIPVATVTDHASHLIRRRSAMEAFS